MKNKYLQYLQVNDCILFIQFLVRNIKDFKWNSRESIFMFYSCIEFELNNFHGCYIIESFFKRLADTAMTLMLLVSMIGL